MSSVINMYDLITKKKHGVPLTQAEIKGFVAEYTNGKIPDYQVSALMMAIYFRGMTDEETLALTEAITASGDTLDLSFFGDHTVDKHSSGGVGDKTTLIVAPIAASLGCKVAKMSGRVLGHTGGTVDKLESMIGFKTTLTKEEFLSQVEKIGIAVIGQSENLAPADKKLYALRDVSATVDSMPLIVSSIMGKKLASGSKNIVLDVKYGSGSFMKTASDAEALAEHMVEIGKLAGRKVRALITNMDTPLGYAIGNALEVKEAIEILSGRGPDDLLEVCTALASAMVAETLELDDNTATIKVKEAIVSGSALNKFREWISMQGADLAYADDLSLFKSAKYEMPVLAQKDGYIAHTDAERIGRAATLLGAGREKKDDTIDYSAGIVLKKKLGDKVTRGECIAVLHTDKPNATKHAEKEFLSAVEITSEQKTKEPLIYKIIK